MFGINCRYCGDERQLKTLFNLGHGLQVGVHHLKKNGETNPEEKSTANSNRLVEIRSRKAGVDLACPRYPQYG